MTGHGVTSQALHNDSYSCTLDPTAGCVEAARKEFSKSAKALFRLLVCAAANASSDDALPPEGILGISALPAGVLSGRATHTP